MANELFRIQGVVHGITRGVKPLAAELTVGGVARDDVQIYMPILILQKHMVEVVGLKCRVQASGHDLRQLTYAANGSQSLTPVWSPNGQQILFQREFFHGSTPTGGALYTIARNGGDLDRVTVLPAFVFVQGGGFFYSWGTAQP